MTLTWNQWTLVVVTAYFLLFVGAVVGIQIWKIKRRHERPPIIFKLLRGPGESLRRRMAKFDENFPMHMFGVAMIPWLVVTLILVAMNKWRPQTWIQLSLWCGAVILGFVGTLVFAMRWAMRNLLRYRNDHLGYMGEREVAEHLQPLLAKSYRVFHDVPAEGGRKTFNLDHVAVGPAGVSVIEVKTRRKGRARPGFKDHVVVFDGQQLIWPWGEDSYGLDQARAEADWLRKWINQRVGIDTPVKPILALPGWWVEARVRGAVSVINSKSVASAVEGNGPAILTDQQIDLIARQLDVLCRDVED